LLNKATPFEVAGQLLKLCLTAIVTATCLCLRLKQLSGFHLSAGATPLRHIYVQRGASWPVESWTCCKLMNKARELKFASSPERLVVVARSDNLSTCSRLSHRGYTHSCALFDQKAKPLETEILEMGIPVTWVGKSKWKAVRLCRILRELICEPVQVLQVHIFLRICMWRSRRGWFV